MEWNNLSSILDNGRSKPTNLALGALGGLVAGGQRQGYFYPQMSWAGNGVARTRLGYVGNPDYVSPYGFSEAMGEAFRKRNNGNSSNKVNARASYNLQNIYGKLSGIGTDKYGLRKPGIAGNIGNFFHDKWSNIINKRFGDKGDLDVGSMYT